jgi:hypothetical protein
MWLFQMTTKSLQIADNIDRVQATACRMTNGIGNEKLYQNWMKCIFFIRKFDVDHIPSPFNQMEINVCS